MQNIKMTLVGDGAVGKHYLTVSFKENRFAHELGYFPYPFLNYDCNRMVENKPYRVAMWLTAGQADYDRLRPLSYPNTDIFLICFAIHKRYTLNSVTDKWIPEVDHFLPNTPRVLVGCNSDFRKTEPNICISRQEIEAIAKKLGLDYYETSALTQEGVQDCFENAIKHAIAGMEAKSRKFEGKYARVTPVDPSTAAHQSKILKIQDNEFMNLSYESYDMRVMVVGKYGVGKTTLVMLLVGDEIPWARSPTDGIGLIEGRCGLDIASKEWIFLDKDSYDSKGFLYDRMLMPHTQENTENIASYQQQRQLMDPAKKATETQSEQENKATGTQNEPKNKATRTPSVSENKTTGTPSETENKAIRTQIEPENKAPGTSSEPENKATGTPSEPDDTSLGASLQPPLDQDINNPMFIHPEFQFAKRKMKTKLSKAEFKKRLEFALKNGTYKMQMGRLFFWDFGGQYVFYTTHQSFLTYRALFLVIFDGTENLHDIYSDQEIIPGQHGTATSAVFLQHWVNSILTYCKTVEGDVPKILFVATHKDRIPKEKVEERRTILFDEVNKLFQDHEGRNHLVLDHRIFVNARDKNDPEIKTLRKVITELTFQHPCWGERMPTSWVPLELEITELVRKGNQIISLRELEQLNNDSKVSVLDQKALKSFLLTQHSLGKIVYFDTPELKDFVIINPLYMVDVTKSFVTDKHFWPTDSKATFENMTANGIISKQGLFSLWKRKQFAKISLYSEFVFNMLLHLDIIAEQRRYDLKSGSRLEAEFLFVPCMLANKNPTDYLDQVCDPEHAIGLAFVFKGAVVPPALPNRLISACLNIWALKTYKGIKMLFSGLIVLSYDESHEIIIRVQSSRIVLFIVHNRSRGLIVRDISTSVREDIQTSLERISDFYERSITGKSSSQLPFHVEHACPELTCFHPASELLNNKSLPCSGHGKQYEVDVWYQNKKEYICEENCQGLSADALSKMPSDPELLRLSLQFGYDMMYELAIELEITAKKWDDLRVNHPQSIEIVQFLVLIQWRESKSGTFKDVFDALKRMKVDTHRLCQVRRKMIKESDIPEEHLDSIPTDDILDELASKIGLLSFQLGVELGRNVTELEIIQYDHRLNLVEQSREILHNWRDEQTIKATFGVLEQALVNIGKGSMCLKRTMEVVGVKQHQYPQHKTQRRRKRCSVM